MDYEARLEYAVGEGVVGKRVGDDGGREFLVKYRTYCNGKKCEFASSYIYIYIWEKYYLAPSTTSDLLFSPLKYKTLLNGPPQLPNSCVLAPFVS
jgi:hypothetical protein